MRRCSWYHHHRRPVAGNQPQARVRRVQEPGHLLRRFALDPHGQAKSADFQVAHGPIEHLAEQVGRLFPAQGARAIASTADLLEVCANAHRAIVLDAGAGPIHGQKGS